MARFQSNVSRCVSSYKTSTSTYYFGAESTNAFMGPVSTLNENNLVVGSNGFVGAGTTGPSYKLDVRATGIAQYTPAYFQNTNTQGYAQIVIAANKAFGGGDTGPRNSFVTFSRYDSSPSTDKWSIGNLYEDTVFPGLNDSFVFIKNGYNGASPDVVAKLSTAGNLDIDGSYTTASSYCKGQYIQVHTASLAGTSHIYIDPFGTNASSASNNSNIVGNAHFGVAMYDGSLQRIRFSVTSITPIANVIFQFYAITPAATGSSTTNNIGDTTDTANVKYTTTIASLIAGTTTLVIPTSHTFSAGQLLQFRLFTAGPTALNVVVQMTASFRYIIV